MSWRWERDGQNITSTCLLCRLVITGRRDNDITQGQRTHNVATCQQRREAARDTDRGYQIDRVKFATTESTTPTTGATT